MFLPLLRLCVFACYATLVLAPFVYAASDDKKHIMIGFHDPSSAHESPEDIASRQTFYRLLQEVEAMSNYHFTFHKYNLEDGWADLAAGSIDIYGPARMEYNGTYRNAGIIFNKVPIEQAHVSLVFKASKNLFYDDPASLEGKTIATFKGNPYNDHLENYLREHDVHANYVYGTAQDYHTLNADLYLTTSRHTHFNEYLTAYNFMVDSYYFAALEGNQLLVQDLDRLFKRALAENGTLLQDLYVQSSLSGTTKRSLTRNETQILRNSAFSVGYTIDHQPIQFTNMNGQADGISIEIMQLLADKYGFKVDFEGYDPDVEGDRKNYDILLASQDVIPDLHDKYHATDIYLELPLVLFVDKKKLPELEHDDAIRTVGIYNYIGFDYAQVLKKYSNPKIVPFNSISDAVTSYFSGELDAGLFTLTGAEYITDLVGDSNFSMVSTEFSLPLRIYVSKELSANYVDIFNVILNHVDKSLFNIIISRQTANFTPEYSLYKLWEEYRYIVFLLVFVLLGSVLGFIFYSARKKRLAVLDAINHDELTGLSSFYHFTQQAPKILQHASENEYQIVAIDLDHFSLVSKFLGFAASREVILAMSKTLDTAFEGDDILVSRVVSEQFVILCPYESLSHVKNLCEQKVLPAIQKVVGERFCISLSVGVYVLKNPQDPFHEQVDRANVARNKGKSLHKNTYYYFDDSMQKRHEKEALIVSRMEQAVKDEEFVLVYQPKINFTTLTIGGAEALVRWYPKDGNVIYPDEFINVFESNGFIENLDFYVFEHVCKFIQAYSSEVEIPLISANLSSFTLRNTATPGRLWTLLNKYDLEPHQVELEITESALTDDANILQEQVDNLKKVGFTVSMDDFGSGVSSLNRLASINVDVVKLDKAFLDFNINEDKGSVVVENVIRLTKDLDMKVVCEGVETLEQALWLKSLQCNLAQGYYFERPLSQADFLNALREGRKYILHDSDSGKVMLDI